MLAKQSFAGAVACDALIVGGACGRSAARVRRSRRYQQHSRFLMVDTFALACLVSVASSVL
jgi:hypothetical protein